MPVFKVTDPATGVSLKLTGDSPPTEQELEQIFSQFGGQGDTGLGADSAAGVSDIPSGVEESFFGGLVDTAKGAVLKRVLGQVKATAAAPELAASLVTGAIAEPVSGIAGLAASPFIGGERAGQLVEDIQQAITFQPRTATAQAEARALGESPVVQVLSQGLEGAERIGAGAGEFVGELVGAPGVGHAIGTAIPTAILDVIGIKGVGRVRSARLARKHLAEQIKLGVPNVDRVTKQLNAAGDIVTSKSSKQAVSNLSKFIGREKAIESVSVLENMSDASKAQVNKMLDIIDRGKKEPLFKQANRPSDVLGKAVANRAVDIAKINKKASREIGEASDTLKSTRVDISAASDQFFDDLGGLGVTFEDVNGRLKPDFTNSTFVGGGKAAIEKLANFVRSGDIDGKRAHEIKQFARERVDFGAGTVSAVSRRSQSTMKNLAAGIDEVLDDISPKYKRANEKFAKTVELKNQFQKLAGKAVDLMSDLAPKALGGKARRLVSNAESRVNIEQQLIEADKVLADLGIRYKDDIPSLNHAVTQLESIFKIEPPGSFQGRIERGVGSLAGGRSASVEGLKAGAEAIRKLGAPDFDKQMKTLRELTRRKPK